MIKKILSPLMISAIALLSITTVSSASDNKAKVSKSKKSTKEFQYNLVPKKVSDNVWCFFGALEAPTKENAGNMSNSCYIKADSSYILWDTGPSYVYAKQAYAAMSKIAKLPVSTVILSHEHDDHWLGNNYYKEVHNAKLIGPESINKNYKVGQTDTRMFQTLSENAIRGTKIIHVDEWHKEGIKFKVDGVELEYVAVGNGHSAEDFFMYMPKNKLIFAGDLVMNGRITSNRDGSVLGQLKALEMINSKEWNTLIPGHGFIINKTAANESVQYFTLTKDRILEAMKNGIDSTGIVEAVPLLEFKDKAMYKLLNSINVSRAYDELSF
ncbi:MBL fold metallo-hydrolase [Sulfurimonas sp.]|uniref:MBL fold metallo-hydrolase n=1 Tax=Sulfurimonas sp. TaxID=2022749 RepID=UPI0026011EFF|nr:MBL fold metallo-hydrolase [Sulfurimonas sp.]MDD5157669.1 MBL fold metallo-hydrolase [Sulfurimonas sp.]